MLVKCENIWLTVPVLFFIFHVSLTGAKVVSLYVTGKNATREEINSSTFAKFKKKKIQIKSTLTI